MTTDTDANIVVAGETYSDDFPIANAVQSQRTGYGDVFVAKLTPAGDALLYSTYFGGSMHEDAASVDVDAAGAVYVAGYTASWDFPTRNAFQSERRGYSDAFVMKLDATGGLVYSTLLGGALEEMGTQSRLTTPDGHTSQGQHGRATCRLSARCSPRSAGIRCFERPTADRRGVVRRTVFARLASGHSRSTRTHRERCMPGRNLRESSAQRTAGRPGRRPAFSCPDARSVRLLLRMVL